MGLKAIIREQKILASGAVEAELVLPGEPLIYSIKYKVGQRTHSVQFFRDMKWKSLIKCWFRSQYKSKTPVVILVRFYVSPPESVTVKAAHLKSETVPAAQSFEICEYLLSFLEMLHHVLINCYRQVVKVDVEKFYSADPRTVFKFMTWSQYVSLQDSHPVHSEGQGIGANRQMEHIQPDSKRNAADKSVRIPAARKSTKASNDGSTVRDNPLPDPCTHQSTQSSPQADAPSSS